MGRPGKKTPKLQVDARKFVAGKQGDTSCSGQTAALLMCLQSHEFNESPGQCAEQYEALSECSKAARAAIAARKGHMPSINYHLGRITKFMRR